MSRFSAGSLMRKLGWQIVRRKETFADVDHKTMQIVERVAPYTMTSPERCLALVEAIRYVARNGIKGSIVECGVWRGGSMMAAALALLDIGCSDRELFLFDTFTGMPAPREVDVDWHGTPASEILAHTPYAADRSVWCYASLEDVDQNMRATRYEPSRVHLVPGRVEDTIPSQAPLEIALLRLDTDWYESTRHELEHLYPRLANGGVLILDDYGYWQGARRATDEFLGTLSHPLFLHRVDSTGRLAIKP